MVDNTRIGDQERSVVADRLRKAFAEGRIDEVELEERLAATYQAKVATELVPITADLPVPADKRGSSSPAPAERRNAVVAEVIPALGICALVTVIYLFTNAGGDFWPRWVYLGMAIGVAVSLWTGRPMFGWVPPLSRDGEGEGDGETRDRAN